MKELRYNGLFIPPDHYGMYSCIPYIEDLNTDTLFVFILYPGCFNDAYHFAKRISLSNIVIIPVSMANAYCGEIMNLQNKLIGIKSSCKVVFPGDLNEADFNIAFRDNYIQTDHISIGCANIAFKYETYTKTYNYCCDLYHNYKYVEAEEKGVTYYDIEKLSLNDAYLGSQKYGFVFDLIVTVYGVTTYISLGLSDEKIKELDSDSSISEVHLPFKSYFGNLYGFKKAMTDLNIKDYISKIRCNAFANIHEWDIFTKHHKWYDGGRYVKFYNFPRQ